jgi:hypothetical protein
VILKEVQHMGDTIQVATSDTEAQLDADFEATLTFLSPAQAVFEAITKPEGLSS